MIVFTINQDYKKISSNFTDWTCVSWRNKFQLDCIYTPLDESDILRWPFCALSIPSLGKNKQLNQISNKMIHYSDSVKCDSLRALVVENFAHPCDIDTLNKCEDHVWNGTQLSKNEMNANMSHKDFIRSLRVKG